MIEIEDWQFGGNWLHILEDNHIEIAQCVLEQLYAQMMEWT